MSKVIKKFLNKLAKYKMVFILIAVFLVLVLGYQQFNEWKYSQILKEPIDYISCEFTGKIEPGEMLTQKMIRVTATTSSGLRYETNDYTVDKKKAPNHGGYFDVTVTAGEKNEVISIPVNRTPTIEYNIGYPEPEDVKATFYSNGDLDFSGEGNTLRFKSGDVPWADHEYAYISFSVGVTPKNMDYWFADCTTLMKVEPIPKSVETMRGTFSGCTALKETPNFFQCTELRIMTECFLGCTALQKSDSIPMNVENMELTYSGCTSLINPPEVRKATNLMYANSTFSDCTNLIAAPEMPVSVTTMNNTFKNCTNIRNAVPFPSNIYEAVETYAGCISLEKAATLPDSLETCSGCYAECVNLYGKLEINTNAEDCTNILADASQSGKKLIISGKSGRLVEIKSQSDNRNIVIADAETATKQAVELEAKEENY